MSGNAKFRCFLLASILVTLFFVVASPVSWAGELEDAQEAVRQNPNDANAHYNLGVVYLKSGQHQKAIAPLKKAIRIKPDYAAAHNNLGYAYKKSGQYKEAITSYKEAIRIKPDYADAHYNLGNSYARLGHKEAIASYKEMIRINPIHLKIGEAHWGLGRVYEFLGHNDEAIASYKEALSINPNLTVVRNLLNKLEQKIAQSKPAPQFSIEQNDFLEDAQERVRLNPNDAQAHAVIGDVYRKQGRYQDAIASYKESIRVDPNFYGAYDNLSYVYSRLGRNKEALPIIKEAIRLKPDNPRAHWGLGMIYELLGHNDEAIASFKEALRINPDLANVRNHLNELEQKIAQAKPAPQFSDEESNRLARERKLLEEERKKLEALRLAEENRQRQQQAQAEKEPSPQSGTGSGFFVSKMGHVITNAHVVQSCKKITIGDNANKQVPAELINTDRSNDLALLKLSTLAMASAESKSLIQKLGIVVVPLASKGLLRSEDVKLGEKVLVAGYPFGELFSNTIKVTSGIVSATRGAGDDSGQFQLDAAVQPGNSGGPIYDSSGNIVGVVISQLDKLKMAKAIGSLPENVNFGIKASTVRQFLTSSGLPSKKSERTEEKSTEQLAEIAKNQALMVMCLQ